MRRPGKPGPISTGGSIKLSEIKDASTIPVVWTGAWGGGSPGAIGQKAGDIGLDADYGYIFIADVNGDFQQVYP